MFSPGSFSTSGSGGLPACLPLYKLQPRRFHCGKLGDVCARLPTLPKGFHNKLKKKKMPGFRESLHSWRDSEVKWLRQIWANNQLKLNFPIAVPQPQPAASSHCGPQLPPPPKTSQNTAALPILRNLPFSLPPFFHPSDGNSLFLKTPPSPRCPNYTVAR